MKKIIRQQLIELANQILDEEKELKTANVKELLHQIQEKLIILEFLEKQIEGPEAEIEESVDSKTFREENWFVEPEPVPQPPHEEDLVEPLMEKIKDIVAQMPEESEQIDMMLNKITSKKPEPEVNPEPQAEPKTEKPKTVHNDLEEFAAHFQKMPEFERKNPELFPPSTETKPASPTLKEYRPKSLNETANRGLNIGLNDRLAFIKHLFEGQAADYTRVLSQINTLENFGEAQRFIDENVKPDYNNWANKEEYSNRFMALVERSFN